MNQKFTFLLIIILLQSTSSLLSQIDTNIHFQLKREVLNESNIISANEMNKQEVVSASRSSKNVWDLPITVFVVTREEILQNGYFTLVDVMKNVPGIKVSQPGSGEEGETFLMRGLQGNYYTKILINGVPIQPSVTMSMPIGAQLPIRQAKRIEIIFGPASAVYGSDATAGVINIITKDVNTNYFAQADLVAGNNGYTSMNFTVGGKAGKNKNILEYVLYGSKTEFKDMNILYKKDSLMFPMMYFYLIGQTMATTITMPNAQGITTDYQINENIINNVFKMNPDSFYQKFYEFYYYKGTYRNPEIGRLQHESKLFGIDLKYKKLRFTYNFMNRTDPSSLGLSGLIYRYNDENDIVGENIQRSTLSYDWKIWKFFSNTTISYNKYRQDENSSRALNYVKNLPIAYRFSASDDIFVDHLITANPTPDFEIVAGLNCQYSSNLPQTNDLVKPFNPDNYKPFGETNVTQDPILGNFGINPMTFYNLSAFFQFYYKYKRFTLIIGSRHDHHSRWGSSTNPRIALLFKLNEKSAIRASIGQAYKAPSATAAYFSLAYKDTLDKVVYDVVPNPDLKPEIFYSFELGFKHAFSDKFIFDSYFYTYRIQNLILPIYTPIDTTIYPNAYTAQGEPTRTYINSNAYSILSGFQLSLRFFDLIPSIKLNSTLNLHFAAGREELATDKLTDQKPTDNKINNFRMMPKHIGQFNINMSLIKNSYLCFFNTWMTSWYRKFIPNETLYNLPITKIDGYYNLDFIAGYKISRQLDAYVKVTNVFNKQYGGIDAMGMDIDLRYNPQLGRNVRFGLSFRLE